MSHFTYLRVLNRENMEEQIFPSALSYKGFTSYCELLLYVTLYLHAALGLTVFYYVAGDNESLSMF